MPALHLCRGGCLLAREWRRIRRSTAELSGLSDRMLKDIGVGRHDIERLARYGRDATDVRA